MTDRATLDALYKDSAFTIEGLAPDDESLGQLAEWVKRLTAFKREDFYIIDGKTMNREYRLTGTNAYPDTDCTEQLWETTLDPERRKLKLVEIEDALMASEVTELLMGSDVAPRKQFIYKHAKEAEIDV